jgi:sRNA-binding protein
MERLEQERILRDQAEQERAKREQAERERESTAEYTKAEQERVKHEKPEEKVTQSNYYFPKRIGAEQDLRVKIGRIAARARIVQYGKPITKAELEEALIALEQLNKQGQIRLGEYSEYKQLLSDGISRL